VWVSGTEKLGGNKKRNGRPLSGRGDKNPCIKGGIKEGKDSGLRRVKHRWMRQNNQ